jgi:hypothetical protein
MTLWRGKVTWNLAVFGRILRDCCYENARFVEVFARARSIVMAIKGIVDRERNRHLPKSKLGEATDYALTGC